MDFYWTSAGSQQFAKVKSYKFFARLDPLMFHSLLNFTFRILDYAKYIYMYLLLYTPSCIIGLHKLGLFLPSELFTYLCI